VLQKDQDNNAKGGNRADKAQEVAGGAPAALHRLVGVISSSLGGQRYHVKKGSTWGAEELRECRRGGKPAAADRHSLGLLGENREGRTVTGIWKALSETCRKRSSSRDAKKKRFTAERGGRESHFFPGGGKGGRKILKKTSSSETGGRKQATCEGENLKSIGGFAANRWVSDQERVFATYIPSSNS